MGADHCADTYIHHYQVQAALPYLLADPAAIRLAEIFGALSSSDTMRTRVGSLKAPKISARRMAAGSASRYGKAACTW